MIGRTLSHFEITERLGEGGMGVVWKAWDRSLRREVALKVLGSKTLGRADMRARFLREARTAAALNHPSICTIYEVGQVEGTPFIAMELIEGRTLDRHLEEVGQLPVAEINRVASRIAEGLAAAHAGGIVHRDLKPANVMLTDDDQVKILDFGLARPELPTGDAAEVSAEAATITSEMTSEGTVLGTVAYMSPEQAQGIRVDSRSDVFSFGILLYRMATGAHPFGGDTPTSIVAKIIESEPLPPSQIREGLPADLDRIVGRCLRKRPDERYSDTRALLAALHELDTDRAGGAAGPTWRRRRALWVMSAALASLVAVVVFVAGPRSGEHGQVTPAEAAATLGTPSVAVLPFHNLSSQVENEYFSAGMTEEIIGKLSRIGELEVASRSQVAAYTASDRDVEQIGDELQVRYVLDGSVRRAGDQVRIATQLVDTSSGRSIWSETFQGTLEDVFALQEKTALMIAEQLDLRLTPQEESEVHRRSTENVLAYDAFLRAEALVRDWGDVGRLDGARDHYERALELDPDYAPALAGLATVEAEYYRNFDSSESRIQHAEELASRAATLDPRLVRGQRALAEIAGMRYDYQRGAILLREVVRLDPSEPSNWDMLSWALAYQTPPDADGAVEAAEEALRLRPNFPGALYHLGRGLLLQGRRQEARRAFEKALEIDSDFRSAHLGLAQYHLAVGEYDKAREAMDRGEKETAIQFAYRAQISGAKGEIDRALGELERAFDMGYRDFAGIDVNPHLVELRETEGYRDLITRYRE